MKKLISLFLAVCFAFTLSSTAFAEIGDNIGGGSGGGAGETTDSRYSYNASLPQGYRITLITNNGQLVKNPIDITNDVSFARQVKRHFGYVNKLSYLGGRPLLQQSTAYKYSTVHDKNTKLPNFFDFNIDAVKDWFTTVENIRWLCEPDKLNFSFDELVTSAKYKLLIEPLVYIKIPTSEADSGSIHAMTSTEGTLASQKDRQIAYNLAAILRRQLPVSMFLEFDDSAVGISAYSGKTNWGENEYIPYGVSKSELGVGIIYFGNEPGADTDPDDKPDEGETENGYAYDFSADSLTIHTSPIREENDFNVSAAFTYQQKIDCKYCTTECDLCGLTGEYLAKISKNKRY